MNLSNTITSFFTHDIYQNDNAVDNFKKLPRPYISIGYVFEGRWEYREYRHGELTGIGYAEKGDLLFVPMGSTYDGFWHGENIHVLSFHFETNPIGIFTTSYSYVQKLSAAEMSLTSSDDDFNAMTEYIKIDNILKKTNNDPKNRDKFELIWRFYKILEAAYPLIKRCSAPDIDPLLEPALKYLRENYASPCSVSKLAKLCNLSDSHFYKRFKQSIGITPVEFKNRILISNAQKLLIDSPDLSIEELSISLGFSSSIYFRRIFKQITQMTPRDFRKKERNLL